MALTYPRDMTTQTCWDDSEFRLRYRQEFSETPSGTQAADLAPALWFASYRSYPLKYAAAWDLYQDFETLSGAAEQMLAVPQRHRAPRNHAGEDLSAVTISSVNDNRRAALLSALPANFTLARGDLFAVTNGSGAARGFYAIGQTVTDENGDGTAFAQIHPAISPDVNDGDTVTLIDPACLMRLVTGSLDMVRESHSRWRVVFEAEQVH